ncbi:hypothetical protein I4F81_006939 [Pyropia yezoensis]|uniref:Uncharacterized protein n=1 Tax=Pyropia yezoensis TaxID=2788 RepID=A0ACC3C281_PYRYE|nr:hypothetical protein I4F81_006939 [Neopyropia yezoensis]
MGGGDNCHALGRGGGREGSGERAGGAAATPFPSAAATILSLVASLFSLSLRTGRAAAADGAAAWQALAEGGCCPPHSRSVWCGGPDRGGCNDGGSGCGQDSDGDEHPHRDGAGRHVSLPWRSSKGGGLWRACGEAVVGGVVEGVAA